MPMINQYPDVPLLSLSQQENLILDSFLQSQQRYADYDGSILAQNRSFCLTNGGINSVPRYLLTMGIAPIFW